MYVVAVSMQYLSTVHRFMPSHKLAAQRRVVPYLLRSLTRGFNIIAPSGNIVFDFQPLPSVNGESTSTCTLLPVRVLTVVVQVPRTDTGCHGSGQASANLQQTAASGLIKQSFR
jgi:hypothetical protein